MGERCADPSGIISWGWRKAPAAAYKVHISNKAPFSVKELIGKERREFRLLSHLFCACFACFPRALLESALGSAGIASGAMAHPSPYLQQLV